EGQQTDPPRGHYEARGMSNRLGNAESFLPEGPALGKHAQLGMTRGEPGTRVHSRQNSLAEALIAQIAFEGRHALPAAVDRPLIITLGLIGKAEVVVRHRTRDYVAASRGEGEGALTGGNGLVIRTTA